MITKKRKYNLVCLRCGHKWKSVRKNPKRCPCCKSPNWNKMDMKKFLNFLIE
jgi:rubrerythrin